MHPSPLTSPLTRTRRLQASSSFYAHDGMAVVHAKHPTCDDFCSPEAVRPNDDAYYAS
jgi:hypothetical protein